MTGLLHNMCARPRSTVKAEIRPVAGDIAVFTGSEGGALRLDPAHRVIWTRGLGAAPDLVGHLERFWRDLDLRGAFLVFPWKQEMNRHPTLLLRHHPLLVLNVLARTRSTLLLARSPLDLEAPCLDRSLVSTDPALLALVRRLAKGGPR